MVLLFDALLQAVVGLCRGQATPEPSKCVAVLVRWGGKRVEKVGCG